MYGVYRGGIACRRGAVVCCARWATKPRRACRTREARRRRRRRSAFASSCSTASSPPASASRRSRSPSGSASPARRFGSRSRRSRTRGCSSSSRGGGFVVCSFTPRGHRRCDRAARRARRHRCALRRRAAASTDELAPLVEAVEQLDVVVEDLSPESLVRYVELNDRLPRRASSSWRRAGRSTRAVAKASSLPFASPGALLSSQAVLPRSREILIVAQHQHRILIEAIRRGDGGRAEEIAREHARLAQINLDFVLEDHSALDRLAGRAATAQGRLMSDLRSVPSSEGGLPPDESHEAWRTPSTRPEAPSSWRATRRSARTSTRPCRPSSRTGGRSRSSWRETCALFDQSHHMTDLYIEGPDVIRLLSDARRQHLRERRRRTRPSSSSPATTTAT